MDVIKDFLAEYYWIFLIVGVVLLIVLIGFISSTKKKKETEVTSSVPETPEETKPTQEIIQSDVQPMQVNETPQDTFEPSLDSFSSTATEVNVGFDQTTPSMPGVTETVSQVNNVEPVQTMPTQSVNQPEPIMAEPQVGLVIEDKPSVSTNTQTPQVQPMVAQSVNQADPIEAEPTIGLVIEDTGKTVGTTIN